MEESRQTNTVWFAFTAGRGGKMDGLDLWSPNVNIFRAPRWRQCQETKVEASPHYWTHEDCVRHQAVPAAGLCGHAVVGAKDGSALPPKDHLRGAMTFGGYVA